jgi:hypothetical protein
MENFLLAFAPSLIELKLPLAFGSSALASRLLMRIVREMKMNGNLRATTHFTVLLNCFSHVFRRLDCYIILASSSHPPLAHHHTSQIFNFKKFFCAHAAYTRTATEAERGIVSMADEKIINQAVMLLMVVVPRGRQKANKFLAPRFKQLSPFIWKCRH